MTVARVNGIDLSYEVAGDGPLVVMVMGTGSPGRVWKAHQEPALVKAGFRVVTFDNRGIAPSSECADGFTLDDMVADTAALIEHVGGGPALVVGTSLGARITQELALARPDVVAAAVMIATYGRNTPLQEAISAGERALYDNKITLPPEYEAAITAHLNLSPHTLDDDRSARDWLDIIGFSPQKVTPGVRAQLELHHREQNRLPAYRGITRPAMVIGFADDRTLPPKLAREVADAIPGAEYAEVAKAGHFGYLEQPAEVNRLLVEFLSRHR
ncbi:alpha/beta hydrolase fold protein [Gordonia bronchialis DSM 43247]|uniref:Alpha/beta hydrolase fold protein n=1 Tax=Gordonia bronchialis (strain ATCC 25592 / DSM 43247 / BCRC 13721 / JCM 3198 / KCTC 3076 / NBRC 16047 / NCTC 10667) TaxID=526226 RepID=D0LC37_GORB4|nr:alpha/beta hydrolase [Gordonia bronchialis]ACY22424.1 alpha/beta hydrolase fold protein [Gordonia bronchialis DSM 43247]MCC3325211.1 alpha/beta hydrolase [Gordonia bronchialis]STQ65352.1 Putative non-heme bromoperoxidase BpoC [Gordonia bronchialis]